MLIYSANSTSLIAPRRMGKTVLLDRLVNNIFFKPEYKVAPFYIKFKREEITLRKFLLNYASSFFRQYIAYCLQEPALYSETSISVEDLLEIESDDIAIKIAQKQIVYFLKRYNKDNYEDARNHWDDFIKVPEKIASRSGTKVAIIIDEFQDMKFYVYDRDEAGLDEWKAKNQGKPSYAAVDLTATFDRQSESRKAPMLVSGSAVALIFRTVMGGLLGGRFRFKYLKPLSIDEGATLITKLVKIFTIDQEISAENAIYASVQVSGHPYYLHCLVDSSYPQKSFASTADIDELIEYEITEGLIYGFWKTHFEENAEYINNDTDQETGKKIIYYFTKYHNQSVKIEEIAEKIGISKEEVEAKIEKLYLADLVYKSKFKYYTFNDICLMRFIKYNYENALSNLEKIDLSNQGKYNLLKGYFLEFLVQETMSKFNGEELNAKLFGKKGLIKVPTCNLIDFRYVKGETTQTFQVDVLGKNLDKKRVWLCECKYRISKMGMDKVKKAEDALQAYKLQEKQEKREIGDFKIWLVSTGGFTKELLQYLKDRDDIYYSDYQSFNQLFRRYGGGFDIPIFNKEE